MLRVLVVGAGLMGSLHARALRGAARAVLCGVVDRDASVAGRAGATFGVPAHTDLREALAHTRPDAVVVATPDPAHRAVAEAAAAEGLALLVEKPLATTESDAEAIVAAAERHGVPLMTGHVLRFDLRYAQVADAVRDGVTGRVVLVDAGRFGRVSLGARVSGTTSPLWHFLIHDIDVVQWIGGGVIAEVDGAGSVESPAGLSAFTATGSLTSGARFQLAAGWTLPEGGLSPRMTLRVHGERAHVDLSAEEEGLVIAGARRADRGQGSVWPLVRDRIEGSLRREVDHFAAAVLDGTPFVITPQEALAAVRSAAALERAAGTRTLR